MQPTLDVEDVRARLRSPK